MRRVVFVLGVAIAILGSAASPGMAASRHAPGSAPASTITWGPCTDDTLSSLGAQCGTLSVPLSYRHPGGRQIELAVSRLQHTSSAADYQGAVLTNPGGPGGSGLSLGAILADVLQQEGFTAAAGDYDWIGFDPRGIGSSTPALSCDPNFFSPNRPSYVPFNRQLLRYWISHTRAYAQACGDASSAQAALLRNDTTVDSAKDMDSIRRALGVRRINYYGFSYGTYLGQVYSTLFPSHVRRLVLDSNVDPRGVWYQANLDQDVAFERNINIWFAWLAKYDAVYHLGATRQAVSHLFYATQSALRSAPAGGAVGPDEWNDVFLQPAYYQQTWLDAARLFADWVHDPGPDSAAALVSAYQDTDTPGDDNGYAGYLAVQCGDAPWPRSLHKVLRDNWRVYREAPFITWNNAWFNGACSFWPAPSSTPVRIDGSRVKNALLVDETLDAATPFTGSLEVRKLFPGAVLLAEPGGTSHADSLFGNECVDGTIAGYLATGALPARNYKAQWDKTCAPLPVPVPSATAARASAGGSHRAHRLLRLGGRP